VTAPSGADGGDCSLTTDAKGTRGREELSAKSEKPTANSQQLKS
jgi:hypothetical protein